MEKKIDIKKIVYLSICVVLIVIACIIGVDFNRIALGTGGGRSARMTSLDDMSAMLNSFEGQLSDFGYSANSVGQYDADGSTRESSKTYKSVTVHEQTSGYVSVTNGDVYSTITIQRSMDIGITATGTYYRSVATISSDSRVKEYNSDTKEYELKNHSSDVDMDMEIYMSESRFLLRFNKFSSATDGKNIMGIERVLGQWADFTNDTEVGRAVISSLGSVNNKNFRIFGVMGDYIGRHDEDIFSKRGSVYSLKSDAAKAFASSIARIVGPSLLDNSFECEFDVDLDDDTSPLVTVLLDSDYSDTVEVPTSNGYGTTSQYVSARVYEKDVFEFTNINNTVINIPSSLPTLSAEEFDEYMSEIEENN